MTLSEPGAAGQRIRTGAAGGPGSPPALSGVSSESHFPFSTSATSSTPMPVPSSSTSLWAGRERSGSELLGGSPVPGLRRSRAGTLPSRLPSRLNTEGVPVGALGSLALLSPEGDNEVLWDAPSTSAGSIPRRAPGLAPGSYSNANLGLGSGLNPLGGYGSSFSSNHVSVPAGGSGSCQPKVPPIGFGPGSSYLAPPATQTRARSGSTNSNSSVHSLSFTPFPSIWNRDSPPSAESGSPATLKDTSPEHEDAMRIFSGEFQKRSDPQRMRSYTLTTPIGSYGSYPLSIPASQSGFPSAHQPQVQSAAPAMSSQWRPRAQTFAQSHAQVPNQLNLGSFGKQSQWPAAAEPSSSRHVVVLGDSSPTSTQALWVSNVPPHASFYQLHAVFGVYGRIEDARVFPADVQGSSMAYVIFSSVAAAADAQAASNGAELWPGRISTVEFASVLESPPPLAYILQGLDGSPSEISEGLAHSQRAAQPDLAHPLPQLPTVSGDRVYSAGVLRDLRRRIDTMNQSDLDAVGVDMLQELPVLASDYIGNTVVQQVFERASTVVRDMMLRRLVPVLAQTGTHKNGTWAAQKIIDLAKTPRQFSMIERALRPHLIPLLLDQFGNYVVQGCLKFGAPWNDWVYASVASQLGSIAPNRFGSRAVRAILENPNTSESQARLVAAAVVQDATQLAPNANGNLLVSWLLDAFVSGGSGRFSLVAAALVPQLGEMCTSKVASSTILRLVTQGPPQVTRKILDRLLEPASEQPPAILEQLLSDLQGNGTTFLYRLLTTALGEGTLERQMAVAKIRMALLQPYAQIPQNKRLLEEVGLTALAGAAPPKDILLSHS